MNLYVVRHYKTLINAESRIMGWGDSPPVDGWELDLLAVSRRLKKAGIRFERIYTSQLKRAQATGEFFARRHKVAKIQSVAAVNEVDYGKLFRQSKKWVAENIPEYKTDPDFVFPDGESFTQMQERSVAFVQQLIAKSSNEDVLVVAHAGVIRGLVCHYLGLPYAPNLKQRISHRYIGMFEFEGERCRKYDELGSHSDFVRKHIIEIPCKVKGGSNA
jgi:broad specificity phosphatase PhoE